MCKQSRLCLTLAAVFVLSAGCPLSAAIRKGPYLIYPGDNTQMTVLWQLHSTMTCTLEWGLDTSYSAGSISLGGYGIDRRHTITALTPGTKYYYRLTAGTEQATGSFRSAPAGKTPGTSSLWPMEIPVPILIVMTGSIRLWLTPSRPTPIIKPSHSTSAIGLNTA